MIESSRPPGLAWKSWFSWPTASLRTYLVVMILLATLPFSGLITYQIFARINSERERLHESTQRIASLLAQSVNRELESTKDALHILSYSETIQGGEVDIFEQSLRIRPCSRPSWRGIYLLDPNGNVIFDTTPDGERHYPKGRNMAELMLRPATQQALVSDLLGGGESSRFETRVEVPVTVSGAPLYLLGAHIPISVWQNLVEQSGINVGGVVALYDNDHRLIARNRAPERFVGTLQLASNQSQIEARRSGTARLSLFEGGYSYASGTSLSSANDRQNPQKK